MRVIRALAQAGEDTLEESILSNLFAEELHAPHLFLTSGALHCLTANIIMLRFSISRDSSLCSVLLQ